jgi:hypothetical protein
MFDESEEEVITPAQRALLEVFARELSGVKFPDVDAAVLKEAAERVKEKAQAVERAREALEEARRVLAEGQEALRQKGQRALAYARVYAEDDAELSAKLEAIHLARPARKEEAAQGEESAPKRRGRPPRSRPSAPLFSEGAAPEPEAAPEALAAPPAPVRPPVARPVAA